MDGQSIYSLNTITPSKDEMGVYYVQGQTWQASFFCFCFRRALSARHTQQRGA